MKLAACLVLLVSACAVWAQDAPSDTAPPDQPAVDQPAVDQTPAQPADVPAAEPPRETPWKPSLDVGVRTSLLIPVLTSAKTFNAGGSAGAEAAMTLPDRNWRVRTGVDVGSITAGGQSYYLTTVRPGISYDAFFGPTAFMTFEVEGGWLVATGTNFAYTDGKPCAGAGSSVSFFLGDHVNFRTDVRWLEVFNTVHLVTIGVGFDIIGN
jgi:hypothetical protein